MEHISGSTWHAWDLQAQTILDDGYVSLEVYYKNLKATDQKKWVEYVQNVGGEEFAIKFDSKQYFNDNSIDKTTRCQDYVRNFFAFISTFNPGLECICLTDHNYYDDILIDVFTEYAKKHTTKIIPGVEINIGGIHVLLYFHEPPFGKRTFSEGIRALLTKIGVDSPKTNGVLTVCNKGVKEVFDIVGENQVIYVFAHCNSDNGLFQERPRTDRTHLANIYNIFNPIVLQAQSKKRIDTTLNYIPKLPSLKSTPIATIAPDARSLNKYGDYDSDGNKMWFKCDLSFEGLRQCLYEPKCRIHIGEAPPLPPPFKIDSIRVNIPESSRLESEKFCFKSDCLLKFSPNYTCIVGGRGTGKSTLINLIHEKISPGNNEFFKKNKIRSKDGKIISIDKYIEIKDTCSSVGIEVLSQNEIEEFAIKDDKPTEAIFARIAKKNDSKILRLMNELKVLLEGLTTHINNFALKQRFEDTISDINNKIKSSKNILETYKDTKYSTLAKSIAETSDEIGSIESSKITLTKLQQELRHLISRHTPISKCKNNYDKAYNEALRRTSSIVDFCDFYDFTPDIESCVNLKDSLERKQSEMSKYLTLRGLSPDNLQEINNISQENHANQRALDSASDELAIINGDIESYSFKDIETIHTDLIGEIRHQIGLININLGKPSKHVKPVELEYSHNEISSFQELYKMTLEIFGMKPSDIGTKDNALQDALKEISTLNLNNHSAFYSKISKKQGINNSWKFLVDLFSDERNFIVFSLIKKYVDTNLISHKKISITYGGKSLNKSSFGQRCTAALVVLLSLGNTPIIIDEPEAHLDSLLIADYLVEVIKEAKHNRQIIFATHNANLVLNGDADLIVYLDTSTDTYSNFTLTTIEDTLSREKILALEGGSDAFRKRNSKYYF